MEIHLVELPDPPIGNKIFLAQEHGFYILEQGPCTWRAMANTHMGNGSIAVFDGVMKNGQVDGTQIFNANPPILGMWMFDAYCEKGLILVLQKGNGSMHLAPCTTITWMRKKEQSRRIEHA